MKRFALVTLVVAGLTGAPSPGIALDINKLFDDVLNRGNNQPSGPVIERQAPPPGTRNQPRYQPPRAQTQQRSDQAEARRQAMALQRQLNALGFDAGPVDGLPGRRTRAAVSAFQSSRGFRPTGQLTRLERSALASEATRAEAGGALTPEVQTAEVLELQTYLEAEGYDVGTPDGVWGPRSQRAMDAFRREQGFGAAPTGAPPGAADRTALYARVHGVQPVARASSDFAGNGATTASNALAATPRPSFDCARASTATEVAICNDAGLANLDRELSEAWSDARTLGADTSAQRDWMQRRNACGGSAPCIAEAMETRIEDLTGAPVRAPYAGAGGATALAAGGASGEATAALPLDGAGYTHVIGNRGFVGSLDREAEGLERRLDDLGLKYQPAQLDSAGVVEELYLRQRMAETGMSRREARTAFNRRNVLEREEIISDARNRFILGVQRLPDITPEAPIRLALHGGRIPASQLTYEEGSGFRMSGTPSISGRFYRANFRFGADYNYAPMTREAAKTLLDRAQAAWQSDRQGVVRVFWVTVTGFGTSAESRPGQQPNETPITYTLDRVTLHLHDGSASTLRPEDAIYTWAPPSTRETLPEGNRPTALKLAGELGMPIVDGHVAYSANGQNGERWGQFNLLAGVARDPAYFREDTRFGPLIGLLPPADQTAFLGRQLYRSAFRPSLMWLDDARSKDRRDSVLASVFPDEFKRIEAKDIFFDRYWPRIVARAPRGPLPMRFVAVGSTREYDFEGGFFPVDFGGAMQAATGEGASGVRVAQTYDRELQGLGFASADRFANVPTRLFMDRTRAAALRDFQSRSGTGNQVYLAWWSDLDWQRDGSAIERAFAAANPNDRQADALLSRSPSVAPVRAALKRVAIFADAALSELIMELDPAALLLPVPEAPPEPEVPVAETVGADITEILAKPVAKPLGMVAAVAAASDDPDGVFRAFALRQQAIRAANEFDQPGLIRELRQQAEAERTGDTLWLSGRTRLGTYDLAAGEFALDSTISVEAEGMRGLPIASRLTRLGDGLSLPVPQEIARRIVEEEKDFPRRDVELRMKVRLVGAALPHRDPARVEAILEPQEIVFYRAYREGDRRAPIIVGRLDFTAENAAKTTLLSETFSASDFVGLADAVPLLDTHMVDLLEISQRGLPGDKARLLEMMMALKLHEERAPGLPGATFFTEGVAPFARVDGGPSIRQLHAESFLPRLASYLTARADALGSVFAVERRGDQRYERCDLFQDYANYAGEGPAAQAVAIGAAEIQQIQQLQNRDNGVERVARRVMTMVDRTAVQNLNRSCERHWGMLTIADALVESRLPRGEGVRVEFEVDGMTLYPFQRPDRSTGRMETVETFVIEATARATRMIGVDGRLGAPLEETPFVDQRALEAEARRLEAEAARAAERERRETEALAAAQAEAEALAAGAGAAGDAMAALLGDLGISGAPTPGSQQPAAWPELAGLEIELSERDVLGLRTGQTMAEADRLIRERGGIIAAFETATPPSEINALGYRRLYVTRDGAETITLASYRPDGAVIALMRRIVLAEGRLPYDQISGGLTRKYGDADFEDPMMGLRVWGRETLPERCGQDFGGGNDISTMKQLAPGEGLEAQALMMRRDGMSWAMGLPAVAPELIAGTAQCGSILVYMPEHPETWGQSGFSMTLFDFGQLAAAQELALGSEETADIDIDF
ncbi:MAG: peptidoglycan-binding protein [Pseudomonadota bacterium]